MPTGPGHSAGIGSDGMGSAGSGSNGTVPPEAAAVLKRGHVRLERDGALASVVLARPEKYNAQTPYTWEALREVSRLLTAETRVVVVRAEGKAFSAGLDRAMLTAEGVPGQPTALDLARMDEAQFTDTIAGYQSAFDWLWRTDIVSVAAVQGHAIGAGFQLALACDLRVATEDAQFRMAEPALGLVPDLTGTKRLVDLVGLSRAVDYCLTARAVDATEALAAGLVNRVVAAEALDDAVAALVSSLLSVPRDASVETKALLVGASGRTQADQQAAERLAQHRRMRALAGIVAD